MQYTHKIIVITILFCSFFTKAQNFEKDIKSIKLNNAIDVLAFDYSSKMYFVNDSIYTINLKSVRIHEKYYAGNDELQVIANDSIMIQVDHLGKGITLHKNFLVDEVKDNYFVLIDQLLNQSDSVVFKGIENGVKTYHVFSFEGEVDNWLISINNDGYILDVVMNLGINANGVNKIELAFRNYQTNPDLIPFTWSVNEYIQKTKKGFAPTKKYSNYQILNYYN